MGKAKRQLAQSSEPRRMVDQRPNAEQSDDAHPLKSFCWE